MLALFNLTDLIDVTDLFSPYELYRKKRNYKMTNDCYCKPKGLVIIIIG